MDGDQYSPVYISLTPEARELWVPFFNGHHQELAEHTGDLAAAYAKLEQYAARLALIIHCVKQASREPSMYDPNEVDADSMAAGIALVQWFKREAKRVYRMLSESGAEREEREQLDDQYRLKKWIQDRGGEVTVPEVQRGNRRYETAEDAKAVLDQLADSAYGEWSVESPSRKVVERNVFFDCCRQRRLRNLSY